MANYKYCRLCGSRYLPVSDERICSNCEADIVRAVSMPTGQPVILDAEEHEKPEVPKLAELPEIPLPAPEIIAEAPAPEPDPAPEVPKSAEENRYQKDVVNPTE